MLAAPKIFFTSARLPGHKSKFFCDQQLPFCFSPVWVSGDVRRSRIQNNFGGNYENTA
jgi:hypothetical protein